MYSIPVFVSGGGGEAYSFWLMGLCDHMREKRGESVLEYTYTCHWFLDIFIGYAKYFATFRVTRWCLKKCHKCAIFSLPVLILADIIIMIVIPIWFVFETILWIIAILIIVIIFVVIMLLFILCNIICLCVPAVLLYIFVCWYNKRRRRIKRQEEAMSVMFHCTGPPMPGMGNYPHPTFGLQRPQRCEEENDSSSHMSEIGTSGLVREISSGSDSDIQVEILDVDVV